jgi:hypothetical protein
MARKQSANFIGMNRELSASDEAIAPLLEAAKISTVAVDGKDVPAADAPLPARISALGALLASGDKTVPDSQLVKANGDLAAQVSTLEGKLTVSESTASAQVQKLNELTGSLATAQNAVTKLTADYTAQDLLLKASVAENTRVTGVLNTQKSALAARCIAAGCIDFAKDATEADKVAAAEKLSFDDLFKSYNGAVNAAIKKTGVSFADVPAAPPANADKKELTGRARFNASVAKDFGKK